ncbi:MAG TPA: hypothetical protein VLY03_12175 [Bacteroidota bacterium]|nr:hypothetical protein [Bacteroidota bacterium]
MRFSIFFCCILFLTTSEQLFAQHESPVRDTAADSLREELYQLRLQLDSLKALRDSDLSDRDNELDHLEDVLEKRLTSLENKVDAISRASAPIVLNPRMTAFINFAARADSKSVMDASGNSEISDRPFLRTVEMELLNAVDPYAEARAIISLENQAGGSFDVDAEEAYGLIKKIPILEDAPLGMKVKLGKFRAPFGVNNKIHMHDLPWTTRPLAIAKYLGTEHGEFFESGYNPTGIDVDFFVPNPIPQSTLEMNLDVVRSGDIGLSLGQTGTQPSYIGHLTWSEDWSNEHLLLLGVSAYDESGMTPTQLFGADLTYKWAPSEDRESHSLVAGGEFFIGRHSFFDSSAHFTSQSPYGWYTYIQYQTSYWVYLGLRYDWVKEPTNDQLITRAVAGYLSYYTTEFLRFRLGVEHRMSDIPAQDNLTTGLFEVNFVFGSHPTEPYWVNR